LRLGEIEPTESADVILAELTSTIHRLRNTRDSIVVAELPAKYDVWIRDAIENEDVGLPSAPKHPRHFSGLRDNYIDNCLSELYAATLQTTLSEMCPDLMYEQEMREEVQHTLTALRHRFGAHSG
jgi:hypothetical protein